jgi:hypothetical protein
LILAFFTAADNYTGIYTSTFLDAFKHPRAGMVTKVNGMDVVSNRALKNYLLGEVPLRLSAKPGRLSRKDSGFGWGAGITRKPRA